MPAPVPPGATLSYTRGESLHVVWNLRAQELQETNAILGR